MKKIIYLILFLIPMFGIAQTCSKIYDFQYYSNDTNVFIHAFMSDGSINLYRDTDANLQPYYTQVSSIICLKLNIVEDSVKQCFYQNVESSGSYERFLVIYQGKTYELPINTDHFTILELTIIGQLSDAIKSDINTEKAKLINTNLK